MQGKDLVTSICLTSFLVSHRAGREDAEKEGLESESAPERCCPCLPFSLVPWGFSRADVRLQFVQDLTGLSSNRSPCRRFARLCEEAGVGKSHRLIGYGSSDHVPLTF